MGNDSYEIGINVESNDNMDISNNIFGLLTAIEPQTPKKMAGRWKCSCVCGKESFFFRRELVGNIRKSCGDSIHRSINLKCTIPNCDEQRHSKGLCLRHYGQTADVKQNRANKSKVKDKQPKRKEEKAKNQLNYARTPKGLFAGFLRQLKKQKIENNITLEDFVEIRSKPCSACGVESINFTGVGVTCSGKIADLNTVRSICSRCRLRKPIESFDAISHCRNILRKQWKRSPMASLAIAMSRNSIGAYICGKCDALLKAKQYELDHKEPIHPIDGSEVDLIRFAERVYCSYENLMVLCIKCHSDKTNFENFIRRKNKENGEFLGLSEGELAEVYKKHLSDKKDKFEAKEERKRLKLIKKKK